MKLNQIQRMPETENRSVEENITIQHLPMSRKLLLPISRLFDKHPPNIFPNLRVCYDFLFKSHIMHFMLMRIILQVRENKGVRIIRAKTDDVFLCYKHTSGKIYIKKKTCRQ